MKRPLFFLALAVCASSLLQGAQLYDITLSNAQKYSQCTVHYAGSTMTKFTGKDRSGATVTKEVKTASILLKKPVAPDVPSAKDEPEKPAASDTPTTTDAPAAETAEAPAGDAAPAADSAAATPAPAATEEPVMDAYATENAERTAKAKDATLRLRENPLSSGPHWAPLRLPDLCSSAPLVWTPSYSSPPRFLSLENHPKFGGLGHPPLCLFSPNLLVSTPNLCTDSGLHFLKPQRSNSGK